MLSHKINLVEGTEISNLTVANDTSFPLSPNIGEMFYKTTTPAGMYYYNGTSWLYLSSDVVFDATSISSHILPTTTSTFDIGSTSKRWNAIYVDDIHLSGNTLYLGSTPIMGTNASNVEIKADPDQSISLKTSATGSTTIQSSTQVSILSSGNSGVMFSASGTNADITISSTDLIQLTSNRMTLNPVSSVNVNGNLSVTGIATFSGTSFTVNNTNFRAKDNLLYLNYGEPGSGVTNTVAGIQIDRGNADDFLCVFDETDDVFKVGFSGALSPFANQSFVAATLSPHSSDASLHLTSSQNTLFDGLTVSAEELNYVEGVTGPIQTQLNGILLKSGGTMSGQLNLGNYEIQNVGTPTSDSDLVTKDYVNTNLDTLTWKVAVAAATTTSITLSGTQTVDTYALSAGERVLVKNQSSSSQNGIYVVAAGSWVRSTDANTASELDHATVYVEHGSQAGTSWTVGTGPTVLDTDPVLWVQFNSFGTIIAGTGLSLSGDTLNLNLGSGIFENPSDQVGIELYSPGALMLTVNGTDSSTDQSAQLSLTKTGVTAGTYTQVSVGIHGRVTGGSSPTTLSGYGITDAATSSHTHTFSSLTSKPTTLSGYGITDGISPTHDHTFASLTSKPTTLAGYGITDASTSSHNHDATYVNVGGDTMSGALGVNALITGTAIINGSKNSQTNFSSAGLQSTSTSGNAGISLHCQGASAAYIEHIRNGSGIRILDGNGALAGVQCSRIDTNVVQITTSAGVNAVEYLTSNGHNSQIGMDSGGNPFMYTAENTVIRFATNNADKVYFTAWGVYPWGDNQIACGVPTNRWTAVYAVNGTIQTSDKREKNHIENIENVGSIIDAIQPVRFSWKNTGKVDIGFYAQDVQQYVPEAVMEGDENTPWGMKPNRLTAILWAEVKSLRQRVAKKEQQLRARGITI